MTAIPDLRELLDFALEAAWTAGRVTLGYFQTRLDVERKGFDIGMKAFQLCELFNRARGCGYGAAHACNTQSQLAAYAGAGARDPNCLPGPFAHPQGPRVR